MRVMTNQWPKDRPVVGQWYEGQYPRGRHYYKVNWGRIRKIAKCLILGAKKPLTEGSTKTQVKNRGSATEPPPAPTPRDTDGK